MREHWPAPTPSVRTTCRPSYTPSSSLALCSSTMVVCPPPPHVPVSTSAYVSIRQHTYANVCSTRQHKKHTPSAARARQRRLLIRQHTSAYVLIRQHTSAYVDYSYSPYMSTDLLMPVKRASNACTEYRNDGVTCVPVKSPTNACKETYSCV